MQYISDGGCTISDRPVLLSSGPVWCSSSLIISDSGAEPLGMEGIFLFSCSHEIETTKCKRLKKEQQHHPVNPVAHGWLLAVIKPTTFWLPPLSHNHYSTTAPTPYLSGDDYLRRDALRRLDSYRGVPFSWRQHCHLVQELIYARQKVIPVFGFVRYIMKDLSWC